MFLIDWFTTYIYQPFFNLLVGIYWLLEQIPGIEHADMGVAVIIFTIALRILILPLTLASDRSESERREIEKTAAGLKEKFKGQPTKYNAEIRRMFKGNRRIVVAESINLVIQISIALMLWRLFATGLMGADIHLLYAFMPDVAQPFNLIFLGKYDLTVPNIMFNLVLAGSIFLVEVIRIFTSPFPVSRKEVIRLQLFLPVVSFIIFLRLPAGKTLFVIATLIFTLILLSGTAIRHWFRRALPEIPAESKSESEPDTDK